MRSFAFALVLFSASAVAQAPVPVPPLPPPPPEAEDPSRPWTLTPPSEFADCRPQVEAVIQAQQRLQDARDSLAVGPPLPSVPAVVRIGALLYGDPEQTRALAVTADSGAVRLVRAVAVEPDAVAFEGEYVSGGSRFRVYVAPADTDDPGVSDRRQAESDRRREAVGAADRAVVQAQRAVPVCVEEAAWAWRQQRAEDAEYGLVRATSRVIIREGTESYAARISTVGRGDPLWVAAMTDDEAHFLVQVPTDSGDSQSGWVASSALPNPDAVRDVLRPKMARWDRRRAEREQALFDDTPALLITEIRAVGNYSLSGVRIAFANLQADKTIKYVRFAVRPYNPVGDRVSRARGGGNKTVEGVGPIEPSTEMVSSFEWDSIWYSELIECVTISAVTVIYMDDTERRWRGVGQVNRIVRDPDLWNRCPPQSE